MQTRRFDYAATTVALLSFVRGGRDSDDGRRLRACRSARRCRRTRRLEVALLPGEAGGLVCGAGPFVADDHWFAPSHI
jgi:hypothetical protein